MKSSLVIARFSCTFLVLVSCGAPDPGPSPTDETSGDETTLDSTTSEDPSTEDTETEDGDMPSGLEILEALGAQGVDGAEPEAVASYETMFGRLDANGDSIVTVEEYIESGHFDEDKARAIFAASDRNQDGEMTEDEYVENRIITDEGKLIFESLDSDADGNLIESEFVENAPFEPSLGAAIHGLFDVNDDGELFVPEYLQVWGAWARGEQAPVSLE